MGSVQVPDVLPFHQFPQVSQKTLQLCVLRVPEVRKDGNCILYVEDVGVGGVIHYHHVTQLSIDFPNIFHEVVLFEGAVLPIQAMRNQLFLGIEEIQHCISISTVSSCEYHNLCDLRKLSQELSAVRSDLNLHRAAPSVL